MSVSDRDNPDLTENEDDDVGIPERLRVKRRYTLTEAALDQRRQAAAAPKPGMLGVRNNFKHGRYAASFANRLKPCKSTCEQYPCELVEDGTTAPGGDCLDKAEVLEFFRAVHDAVKLKKLDDFNELAALQIGNNLKILQMLQEDIMRDGTILRREKATEHGLQIEYVLHPALLALPKLIADLRITPDEFMITPKAIARQGTEDEGIKSLADIMSKLGQKSGNPRGEEE